jgi:hypothetical protein
LKSAANKEGAIIMQDTLKRHLQIVDWGIIKLTVACLFRSDYLLALPEPQQKAPNN